MTIITLSSSLWLIELYRTQHSEFTTVKILNLVDHTIDFNDSLKLAKQLWNWISVTQRNDLFRLFNQNTKNQIDAWTNWCEKSLDEDCPLNSYRYVNYYDLHLTDDFEMRKNSRKVVTIVKININRSRLEWVSKNEDEEFNKKDLSDYKFWNFSVAQKVRINGIIQSEKTKEENFMSRKLQHTISRWVRASDAEVRILLFTELSMKLLHEWWFLNFNINAESIRASQRRNMRRAWIKNEAVIEYKEYIFSESLEESINLSKIVIERDDFEINKFKTSIVSSLSFASSENLNTNTLNSVKISKFKSHRMQSEHSSSISISFSNMSDTLRKFDAHQRESSDMSDISSEKDYVESSAKHMKTREKIVKETLEAFKTLAESKIETLIATKERIDKINVMHASQIADELNYLKKLQKNALKEIAQFIEERRSILKNHMTIAIQIRINAKKSLEHAFLLLEKRMFNHRSDWEVSTELIEWKEDESSVLKFDDNFGSLTILSKVASISIQQSSASREWTIESPKSRTLNSDVDLTTFKTRSIYASQLNNVKRRSFLKVESSASKRR